MLRAIGDRTPPIAGSPPMTPGRDTLVNRLLKPGLFLLCLLPLGLLIWHAVSDELGANPIEAIIHQTGLWTLRLLLITLAITPLRRLTGWSELVRLRRMLGLYTYFYALLHFLAYFGLDQAFDLRGVIEDVIKRPYITVGFSVLLMLTPLALTSTNGMIKRLGGKRWKRLHRLVYLCGIGGVVHYLWLVKADLSNPLAYLTVLILLFILRLPVPRLFARRQLKNSA